MFEVVLIGLQGLMVAFFGISSVLKLVGHPHMREEFENFEFPYWIAYLAGGMEFLATTFLVLGFFTIEWTVLGTAILLPVMIGATYTNFVKRPANFGWGTLVIVLLVLAVLLARLNALFPLV